MLKGDSVVGHCMGLHKKHLTEVAAWTCWLNWNPRNHPKLFSQKSWHLGIRNGPIARGFWNLNQPIEQKVKKLRLKKCRYIKDIKITFWDTAQYFHSKQLRKSFEKNLFTKIFTGWIYKAKKFFFANKYCDLLFHASFTKFTGPAKLFLNNNIVYFKN